MDGDDGLNVRNWGYYEPSFKGNLGLQLMSTVAEPMSNSKPPLYTTNVVNQPVFMMMGSNNNANNNDDMQMKYLRDCWMNQQKRKVHNNIFPLNPSFNGLPSEPSSSLVHHPQMQILQQPVPNPSPPPPPPPDVGMEVSGSKVKKNNKRNNNNINPKTPKPKKSKKSPKENGNSSVERIRPAVKKSMDMVINGVNMDISSIPIPVCSCTNALQQCYRWGCGGWQSACCTTTISTHPLPMSTKRRGARIAGRKMSQGAFKKVLEKLASEGYDFTNPIDLRNHWAKHGTNKFVTIR